MFSNYCEINKKKSPTLFSMNKSKYPIWELDDGHPLVDPSQWEFALQYMLAMQ